MAATGSASSAFRARLRNWADTLRVGRHEDKVLLILTLIIGATVGLVVVAFILLTENLGARMYPAGAAAWRRVIIPVVGGLVTGFLLQRYFPDARGSGIPQTKTALFIRGGMIRLRTVLGKFGLSSVSLASGMALGREGPSVQVGAGIASTLGRHLGLSPRRTEALVPIGASAALAAAFNTPIAAVLFTLEEVMGDLHAPVLGSIVLSSATSWIVLHLLLGDEPLFHVPSYQLVHPLELAFYAVLGAVGGLVSVGFVKLLLWLRKSFLRMPVWSQGFQPAVGGLLVGLLGWFAPAVLGVGYQFVSQALNGQMVLKMMALLVGLKLVATAGCYASGNAGGIFGPSLFIGAMMGGAFGAGAHILLPDYTGGVGAYALVGMGAAFAGIIRAPLTSVIMIFEVTRDYSIIVPLMISNLIAYFISSRLQKEPIYEALLHQDAIHLPAAARERRGLLVVRHGARPPVKVLPAADKLAQTLAGLDSDETAWPVVDKDGLLGMVTRSQLEEANQRGRGQATLAELLPPLDKDEKLTLENFPHVHADHPLDTAMRRMARSGLRVLPVVSRTNVRELLGVISLQDVLAAYGLGKKKAQALEPPQQVTGTPVGLLGGVLGAVVASLVLAGILTYFYRARRTERAEEYFQRANELIKSNRYQEAIEQYRDALSISQSMEHRLGLALALVKVGLLSEAEIYLREVLASSPTSGPANLGLARIAADEGKTQDAIDSYHRAMFGSWPTNPQENKVDVHLELVTTLGRLGRKDQARAELLEVLTELTADVNVRRNVAHLLLDYNLAKESAGLFQQILQKDKEDADAYTGLGEAELALGSYHLAQDAFQAALRRAPGDENSRNRLKVTEDILALDPTLEGLRAAERYRRSRGLVERTLGSLDRCLATDNHSPARTVQSLSDSARKALQQQGNPASYVDASANDVALAQQLWSERVSVCGPPGASEEPITMVLSHLPR